MLNGKRERTNLALQIGPFPQRFQPDTIGDVPVPWNENIVSYHLVDILCLIIFYNDNFGVIPGDVVSVMKTKVIAWLTSDEGGTLAHYKVDRTNRHN
jgi:hypothetical protein